MTFAASGAYACSDSPIADLNLSAHYDPVAKRYYIPVGDTLTLDGRGSCDPDEGDPILICTHYIKKFYWNFGDGSIDYYEMPTYYPDGLFEGGTTHTYNAPMICTPTLTVTDNDAAEGHPPDKSDPCSCSLAVVKVDVDMEGVAEDKEENPGGYVPVNEDDDNDNGIADKDDVGQVNGEDNLVAISLSISPPYPILNEGEIKLTTTATAGQLRVWSHPDKQNLIIPNGVPPKYYATWSPQNLPPTLYVEGITPVLPGAELLTLSYAIGPAGIDADIIRVTVVGVNLFRAGGILDDWPKTATQLRSPKYIFGKTDPISVQVNSLNRPPIQETFLDYVKVTSTSAGEQYLNMYYAGNHWYNNWVYPGELLYLATDNQRGDGDNIKVVDEEVLTFWLEIQPGSGSYRSCKTVMVDRAEVGVEWQSNYGTYDCYPYVTLNCSDECAEGFYNNLGTANLVWFKNFDNGDLASKESHWDSGGDSSYADSVDFAFWCGHGTTEFETPRALRFFVNLVGGEKQPPDKLLWSEIDWGDKDLDWVVLNTCRFLDGTDDQLKQMVNDSCGVHLICGYVTDMTVYDATGWYFADWLEGGMSIKDTWHNQCWLYQPMGNTSRVFGATECMSDSIGADGPIQTSRNPTGSSSYTHDDYTKQ
jgi:hypothetical protein